MTGPKAFLGYILLAMYAFLLIMGILSLYLWKIQTRRKKKYAIVYLIAGIILILTWLFILLINLIL